ncbi:fibronectin type III domain-containing protein [Hymenobacter puniceus]|uniref:fibronectin type III domain-containing protein n=1 Tax=Hymenobacter sp. BT190 TaxID=2763505 RepID=UPI0016518EE7|nr:fibronectin type III domain-containing protein [Hymenobacter sp. BT190]MBC6697892.1 fibronectin type III domain-containing protein [Hymenobacter sp. BT190]
MQNDDAISTALPIGFSFSFDGIPYTNVYASSNGFLSFNSSATSNLSNNLTTGGGAGQLPLLAPLWDDLGGELASSAARYQTTGSAPNRVFTFEWLNWSWNYNATTAVISFQVKLYETSNRIEFVYRPEGGAVNSASASIGIAGTGTPVPFLSVASTSASPTVSSATETNTISALPAAGQIYAFSPPLATGCPTPRNLAVTSTTATSAVVTWSVIGGGGTFSINYGPTGFIPGTGGQTITSTGTSVTIPGLAASTNYQFYVTQLCSGSTSSRSNVGTFRTDCVTPTYATLPFSETFENTWLSRCATRDVPGNNWRNTPLTGNNSWRREDDGAAGNWGSPTSYAYTPTGSQSSAHSARFHSGSASAGLIGTMDLYVNLSGAGARELSFDYINTTGSDSLTVQISTNGGATFGPLLLRLGSAAGGFRAQTLALASTSATTVIRFRARADFGSTDIGLDNVTISSCPRVSNVAVSNITGNTATVTFTPVAGSGGYTVVATPTTGPAVTATGSNSPIQLTGLQGLMQYTVGVTSNCGAGQSSAPVTATFTTLLPPISNDEPCTATALPANGTALTTSNLGATASTANGYANPGCSPAANPKDVWFSFVAPSNGPRTLVVTGAAAGQVRLFSATSCNGPFTQLACRASTGSGTAAGPLPVPSLTIGATYYVSVSGYGSSDTQGTFTIALTSTLSTGLGQLPGGEVSVFPTPHQNGPLTLRLRGVEASVSVVHVALHNALGQQVMQQQLAARGGMLEQQLPVQELAKGFYTLRIQVGAHTLTRKVVLE